MSGMTTIPPETEETLRRARKALKANPCDETLHNLVAPLYEQLGRFDEAVPHLAFLVGQSHYADESLYARYVYALQRSMAAAKALGVLDEALKKLPASGLLLRQKAMTFLMMGRFEDARQVYALLHARNPADDHAAGMAGTLRLLTSDMQDGFDDYARRPLDKALAGVFGGVPRWSGEPLAGKKLALWSEQGVGDVVMFLGLLPWIAQQNAQLCLVVTAKLAPLVSRSLPGVEIVSENGLPGIGSRCDVHMPIGDLLQHAIAAFTPADHPPYLLADEEKATRLRESYLAVAGRHGRTRLVGLSWHTTNPEVGFTRNITLDELQPVLSVPGVQFVSLQYGDHAEEIGECNRRVRDAIHVDAAIDAFSDLDGLAAQMVAMDEIITIDNATVHLAGALGVPTTLLLSTMPDWRWGLSAPDCRWYGNVRLERQEALFKWKPVVKRLRAHLMEQVGAAA